MSRQRNEPNDPAAELAGYDLDNSEGTSPEDEGDISLDEWPTNLEKEDLTKTGVLVVKQWVTSTYTNVTKDNIRKFAKEYELSKDTAKTWLWRAYPESRDYSDLTKTEKKAAVVYAAHGEDNSYKQLTRRFNVHNRSLSTVVNGVPDIIDDLRNKHTPEKLEQEAKKFEQIQDDVVQEEEEKVEEMGFSDSEREQYLDYFVENPKATVEKAREDVGIEATNMQIGNVKGGAIAKLSKQDYQLETDTEQDVEKDDRITIEIEIDKERARNIVMNQTLPKDTRNDIVNKILDSVGL